MRATIAGLAAACAFAAPAAAQEIDAGRPGLTESPRVVPTGHWQVESELVGYARNDGPDSWSLLATTFRYGLAPDWDGEIIVAPINHVGDPVDETGFGDVTLRARRAFPDYGGRGHDVALIGYITLPTAEEGFGADEVEAGVLAAGQRGLDGGWDLTWTAGLGAVSDDDDYDLAVSGGAAFGYGLGPRTGAYVELFGEHVHDDTAVTLGLGGTYLLHALAQLDAGVDIGLSDTADDARFFFGWSRLF